MPAVVGIQPHQPAVDAHAVIRVDGVEYAGHFRCRRDDVHIAGAAHDFSGRNGRRIAPAVVKKAAPLADRKLVQHRILAHAAPAQGQIGRGKFGTGIGKIIFTAQHPRFHAEAGQWRDPHLMQCGQDQPIGHVGLQRYIAACHMRRHWTGRVGQCRAGVLRQFGARWMR